MDLERVSATSSLIALISLAAALVLLASWTNLLFASINAISLFGLSWLAKKQLFLPAARQRPVDSICWLRSQQFLEPWNAFTTTVSLLSFLFLLLKQVHGNIDLLSIECLPLSWILSSLPLIAASAATFRFSWHLCRRSNMVTVRPTKTENETRIMDSSGADITSVATPTLDRYSDSIEILEDVRRTDPSEQSSSEDACPSTLEDQKQQAPTVQLTCCTDYLLTASVSSSTDLSDGHTSCSVCSENDGSPVALESQELEATVQEWKRLMLECLTWQQLRRLVFKLHCRGLMPADEVRKLQRPLFRPWKDPPTRAQIVDGILKIIAADAEAHLSFVDALIGLAPLDISLRQHISEVLYAASSASS